MRRLALVPGITFVLAVLALVQAAAVGGAVKPLYLPAPSAVAALLARQIADGTLWTPLLATLGHLLVGWTCACALGIVLGAAIGRSEQARAYLNPTLEFMRPLPASALVPAAILLFGVAPRTVTIVTVFGSVWPVLLASTNGFRSIDARLIESARLLQLGPLATFWKIALPSALTEIVAGARVALAISLIVTIVAEMLVSQGGLGYGIVLAARAYRTPELYAGVVLLGALGLATNAVMEVLEGQWRRRLAGGRSLD